jgi:hypothetical protein
MTRRCGPKLAPSREFCKESCLWKEFLNIYCTPVDITAAVPGLRLVHVEDCVSWIHNEFSRSCRCS